MCYLVSGAGWSLPPALCLASSPAVWGNLAAHSDSWNRTCILLSPFHPYSTPNVWISQGDIGPIKVRQEGEVRSDCTGGECEAMLTSVSLEGELVACGWF